MKNLLIIGAGQYSNVVYDIAIEMNEFDKIAFLDDNNPKAIGKIDQLSEFQSEYDCVAIAIGNLNVRLNILEKVKETNYKLINIVHNSAIISRLSKIVPPSILEAGVIINANSHIKAGCIIAAGAVVNHDCIIEECVHIDCNATVTSNSKVEKCSKVKCGTVY